MYFEFYLDDLEIEEPQGFADIVLNMKRDDNWHGIFFEASTSDLSFYGAAASYLKEVKRTQGLKADVTFKALQACGIYEDLEVIFEGRLDFGKYTESCGNLCLVKVPVEQTGCLMTLRNKYDQKVDIDNDLALDKLTPLQDYAQLGQTISLPAIALDARVEGYVDANQINSWSGNVPAGGDDLIFVRPNYLDERFNAIDIGQLTAINNSNYPSPITPQLLVDQSQTKKCFNDDYPYSARMKGNWFATPYLTGTVTQVDAILFLWDGEGDINADSTTIEHHVVFSGSMAMPISDQPFDESFSGTITNEQITDGMGVYLTLIFHTTSTTDGLPQAEISAGAIFDEETFFKISTSNICPDTTAQYYMMHETLSRVTESITNGCLRVKSDYYGRTDSQPYTATEDGCGALRFVTSGLKIRKALNPAFFVSLKDLFDGLRGIDNIGIGIEGNPFIPGYDWLRVEPVEYFYQDDEILRLPYVPQPEISVQEQLHYSLIKSGYQKWEVERVNGLDEPNSNREYRTSLTSINNPLDITSKLIAGSYPIEITRQQSFADTGAADTTYDNETFIVCVERQAYNFIVERGNVDNAANIFSPQTLYNWRIRPFSNLMRWFKSIANSYPDLYSSEHKLYFSSGTGNFIAEGELSSTDCKLENGAKAENRDLGILDFANQNEATPLWKPDYATFRYPLSVADYKTLKSNPYGYISFQCGTGEWKKGYVQEVRYQLNKGEASFVLKLKYE